MSDLESYPLHDAVARGAVEEIKGMIRGYSDIRHHYVNEITYTGLSPLMIAAMQEDDDEEDSDDDSNELDSSGHTPLMVSDKENQQTRIMRILLDANADPNAVGTHIEDFDENGESSALMWAALQGSITAMRVLIDANADVNLKCDSKLPTALFHAAKIGSCEKTQLLLDAKASTGINITNEKQETAADIADRNGHHDVVQLLLDAKATPRDDWHRMRDACIEGRAGDVKSLLDAGYSLQIPNLRGQHPLLLAAKHDHADIAQLLIAARAQLDVLDQDGMTPLMHSITQGNLGLTKSLINAKANPRWGTSKKKPLTAAAVNGNVDAIRLLIDAQAKVDCGEPTPLRLAVKGGFEDVVRLLLDAKARPDAAGLESPPIHYAIERGDEQIVKMLLDAKAPLQDLSVTDKPHDDALTVAVRHNKLNIMKILIDAKAQPETLNIPASIKFSLRYRCQHTPLATAIAQRNTDAMQLLIEAKARMHVPGTSYTQDLIHCAIDTCAKYDDERVFKFLLENNASSISDRWGKAAIREACTLNRPSIVKILLDHGISPEHVYEQRNPSSLLTKAASENYLDVGRVLIDAKANMDCLPLGHRSALMIAAEGNNPEFVKMLIGNKASLDITDINGRTAISHADLSNLKILADAKASLEVRDTRGHTPLLHAVMQRWSAKVQVLLDVKADTDARCPDGLTPLMHAIRIGATNGIEILLGAHSSFDAQDNEGKTALMHALCNDKDTNGSRILRMLLEHAMAHCVVECDEDEPPAKRCKRTE